MTDAHPNVPALESELEALAPEPKVNILIVDDHAENLLALEAALGFLEQNIVRAHSGREALKLLLDRDFAVILMDVFMPGMDGFETAALIRGRERTQNIPIIFLTAMLTGEGQVFRGYSLGAVDYIFKPFEPEILKAKVSVFIELYKKTEEVKRQAELLRQKNQELDSTNRAIVELIDQIERKNDELELRVASRTAELARANQALQAEIAERRRAEEERELLLLSERKARAEAEAANRAKDEFLATVSHELRTPLTAILGWTRLLRVSQNDPAQLSRGLDTIERNARSQAKLIEDILDVSRIITGKLRLEVQTVELLPVVEMAIEAIRPAAAAKNIHVFTHFGDDLETVQGDPNRLQQVVWNLLSNAVKFTPPGGEIRIHLSRVDDAARIEVADNGDGIRPEFLPHVFDRFSQADTHSTRKHGGLGLGLAIVRYLVEMHGGRIGVYSEGPGKGATFTVELPFGAIPEIDEAAPSSAPAEERNVEQDLPFEKLPSLAGLRILLVDDDPDTLEMVDASLTLAGAEVRACSSVAETLRAMEEWTAHLLVSDIGMPHEDGYSLIRKVRASERDTHRRMPAIALTAFAGAADRERALEAGFNLHISKPVAMDELIIAIASLARPLHRGSNG